ncbi:MAG: proprotein convertase P-domain-containing protein [Verrucomicrobiia bacterium]
MKWLTFTFLLFASFAKSFALSETPPPNTALLNFTTSLTQSAPIADLSTNEFTFFLNHTTGVVWDVKLTTALQHPRPSDLEIYLTSPQGTSMPLSLRNGTTNSADLFNNLSWESQAPTPITDYVVTNGVSPATVTPEGSFDACFKENPEGTWQLIIIDRETGMSGFCSSATLSVTTLVGNSTTRTTAFFAANSVTGTNLPAPIPSLSSNAFFLEVTNVGPYLSNIKVQTWLRHTFNSDLDVYLTSPEGTTVTLTTDNGENKTDVFNGTIWDDQATILATTARYTNSTPIEFLIPEGSLAAFRGEDPNGTWTLRIFDDVALDEGVLDDWGLILDTLPGFITDVTGDHYTDIVTSKGRKIYVLQMINEAPQGASFAGLIPKKNKAVAINEFTGDQQADLLLQQDTFLSIMAFSNSFLISNSITLSGDVIRPKYKVVATTDLNQDGLVDIISQNKSQLGLTLARKDDGVISYQFQPLEIGQTGKIVGADRTNLFQRVKSSLYSIPVVNEGSNSFHLGDPILISKDLRPAFKISGVAELSPLEPGNEFIIQRGTTIGYGPTNVARNITPLYQGKGQGNIGRVIGPR